MTTEALHALMRKEFRLNRLSIACTFIAIVICVVLSSFVFLNENSGQPFRSTIAGILAMGANLGALTFVGTAAILGCGAFTTERNDRSLDFVRRLPVTARLFFLSKLVFAAAVFACTIGLLASLKLIAQLIDLDGKTVAEISQYSASFRWLVFASGLSLITSIACSVFTAHSGLSAIAGLTMPIACQIAILVSYRELLWLEKTGLSTTTVFCILSTLLSVLFVLSGDWHWRRNVW